MGDLIDIQFSRLASAEGLDLPSYATPGAAGMDVRAAVAENAPVELQPGARALIPTGLKVLLPAGFEIQVRPRSGLAYKHGVTVLNTPGTIDSDYRGEIGVVLINHGQEPFTIQRGERIAQLVLAPVTMATPNEIRAGDYEALMTDRGAKGFGSTGRA